MSGILGRVMGFFSPEAAAAAQRREQTQQWYQQQLQNKSLADRAWENSTVGQAAMSAEGVPGLHVDAPRQPYVPPMQAVQQPIPQPAPAPAPAVAPLDPNHGYTSLAPKTYQDSKSVAASIRGGTPNLGIRG